MEISGKVISILPEQSGEGHKGPWRKQDFIIETEGPYPRKVCITIWGDKIDRFDVKEGETITASVNIESREFNGRWYTDVKAWKIEKDTSQQAGSIESPSPFDGPMPPEEPLPPADPDDDLPF
ncbi:MAG: DUF3127 domain-containing protein [Bacteroidales bacterium]